MKRIAWILLLALLVCGITPVSAYAADSLTASVDDCSVLGPEGRTITLNVTTTKSWEVYCSYANGSFNKETGNGNGTVTFTLYPNKTTNISYYHLIGFVDTVTGYTIASIQFLQMPSQLLTQWNSRCKCGSARMLQFYMADYPSGSQRAAVALDPTMDNNASTKHALVGNDSAIYCYNCDAEMEGLYMMGDIYESGDSYYGYENHTFSGNACTKCSYQKAGSTYSVSVTNGTASGTYFAEGDTVTIQANTPSPNYSFKQWNITPDVTFADETDKTMPTAAFIMPAGNVSVVAESEWSNKNRWSFENPSVSNIGIGYFQRIYGFWRGSSLFLAYRKLGDGGLCYGMAATTGAINNGWPSVAAFGRDSLVKVQKTDPVGKLGITAFDYIQYGQILQISTRMQTERRRNKNNLQALYSAVQSNEQPIVIVLQNDSKGDHAVYPVAIDRATETATQCDIIINDSNMPSSLMRIRLFKSGASYTGWEYASYGVGNTNTDITFNTAPEMLYAEFGDAKALADDGQLLLCTGAASFIAQSGSKAEQVTAGFDGSDLLLPIRIATGTAGATGMYWASSQNRWMFSGLKERTDISLSGYHGGIDTQVPAGATATLDVDKDGGNAATLHVPKDGAFQVTYSYENGEHLDHITLSGKSEGSVSTELTDSGIRFFGAHDVAVSAEIGGKTVSGSFPLITDQDEIDVKIQTVGGLKIDTTEIESEKYAIDVQSDGNGTASASVTTAREGWNVMLSATANAGYRFDRWQVVSGNAVLSSPTSNPATFPMPKNAVCVKAIFALAPQSGIRTQPVVYLTKGKSVRLLAEVLSAGQSAGLEWAVLDPAIAAVDATGKVTGLKVGKTSVIISTADDALSATCTVNVVKQSVPLTKLTVSPSTFTLYVGNTRQISAKLTPSKATGVIRKFTSSAPEVAKIDALGLITGLKDGKTTVTVTAGRFKKSFAVTVVTPVPVTGISSLPRLYLAKGKSVRVPVAVQPYNATNKSVTWKVADKTIASVDSSGNITGKKGGSTILTVSSKETNVSATCIVNVISSSKSIRDLTITPDIPTTLAVGRTLQVGFQPEPTNASGIVPSYRSSNTAVALVDKAGVVTAKGAGSSVITVTVGRIKKTFVLTVE